MSLKISRGVGRAGAASLAILVLSAGTALAQTRPTWSTVTGSPIPSAATYAPGAVDGNCLLDQAIADGIAPNSVNCTANDSLNLDFAPVPQVVLDETYGANVQTAISVPCLAPGGSTGQYYVQAVMTNTTAQTRHDLGLYVAVEGTTDALGGPICAMSEVPVNAGNPLGGTAQCGPGLLDLDGFYNQNGTIFRADGPYYNFEAVGTADLCGDLIATGQNPPCPDANGNQRPNRLDFTDQALVLSCTDQDSDGYLDMTHCASWGQLPNDIDIDGNGQCSGVADVAPGTGSKCECITESSLIPAPNLACRGAQGGVAPANILCSVDPDGASGPLGFTPFTPPGVNFAAGAIVRCTASITNVVANLVAGVDACTTDTSVDPQLRCGHAGLVQFRAQVQVDGMDADLSGEPDVPALSVTSVTSGDTAVPVAMGSTGRIDWTPLSQVPGVSPSLFVVGPNETHEMTFEFGVPTGAAGRNFAIGVSTLWSPRLPKPFTPQSIGGSCVSTFSATPVQLAHARVSGFGEERLLEWTTATEAGNVGFHVLAESSDGELVRVNEELIPSEAVDSTRPIRYALDVSGVEAGRFYVEEVGVTGDTKRHGPFRLGREYGREPEIGRVDWRPIRDEATRAEGRQRSRAAAAAQANGQRFAPLELRVLEDGVYRVTFEDLQAAGFDWNGVPKGSIALTSRGQAVPIRLISQGQGRAFGPGDAIEFVGEGIDSLYTDVNVYRLDVDRRTARRMPKVQAPPSGAPLPFYVAETVRSEEKLYSFGSPTEDPWFETRLLARGTRPAIAEYEFQTEGLVEGGRPVELEVDVWGLSSWPAPDDHHVVALINGVKIADVRFDGLTAHTVRGTVPDGVLREFRNTLELQVIGSPDQPWDLVNFDSFRVHYPRRSVSQSGSLLFEAEGGTHRVTSLRTGELAVYRLGPEGASLVEGVRVEANGTAASFDTEAGIRYAVVSASRKSPTIVAARGSDSLTEGRAEYLIVSHASFLDGLAPIVELHEAEGLAVKVVDVEDVYARYSGGVVDPEAIREYVRHAAFEMGTEYLLLVGSDTYDYKDHLQLGSVSFVPTLYAETDSIIHHAPVDPLYGDVDGDLIPDLSVGRFPVRTRRELDRMITKTLEYSGKSWGGTAVFAADKRDRSTGLSFAREADEFQKGIGRFESETAYLDTERTAVARERLMQAVGRGTALTVFFGHSSTTSWTSDGLFTTAEARTLSNSGRPTVVVQWGCWNTYHVEPSFDTLGHELLVTSERGAAAVVGSATLLSTQSEQALAPFLAPRLAERGLSIGHAVTLAKQQLAASRLDYRDVLLGWTILGDPALVIEN